MSSWKRDAASGLVVIVPLLVVAVVTAWVYTRISGLPVIRDVGTEAGPFPGLEAWMVPFVRVGIAVVVFSFIVLAVGYLMRTAVGRTAEDVVDGFFNRLPVLRVVYNASKLAVETALSGTEDLQKPVRLETWPGVRMTAFKTGRRTEDGRVVLFMPTAPNITTGFVIEVEPEAVTETEETVEEALTRILSAGFAEEERGVPIDVDEERGTAADD
jgi:uncharacterized membrane protein